MDIQRWDIYTRPTLNNQSIETVYTYPMALLRSRRHKRDTQTNECTRAQNEHILTMYYTCIR